MTSCVTYVDDFGSNDLDEEEEKAVCCSKPKRKRTLNRVWIKREEFDSAEEAEKSVMLQNIWKKSSSKNTLDGNKVEYRCSLAKYRVEECPAGLYLLYHSTSSKVSLFTTNCDHNNHNSEPGRGLGTEMKIFVKQIYEDGIQKPNAILAVIRENNMSEPPKSKLITFLKQLRCEKNDIPTISGIEITKWCEARENIPDSKDEPFVMKHTICCEAVDPQEQDIKIILSTLRLLKNLKRTNIIQIDTTNKIIWQGYPVMIVGTSDKDQVFHTFAIAICKGESVDDFGFIFEALHNFDLEWKPQLLLSNSCESITQGFTNIFGEPKVRLTCFANVLKKSEKFFKKLTKCEDLKQDIYFLQTCKDKGTFQKASKLFLEKWSSTNDHHIDEFIDYFKSQWLLKNSNWYEGTAVGYPSTNKGLEATNTLIKKEHTLRERLPVGQFLNNVLELLSKWSKDRDPESSNFKDFQEIPSVSLQLWTEAYQWAMLSKKVLQENCEEDCHLFYVCSNSTNESIDIDMLTTYKEKEGEWESFDDFKMFNYSIWVITINYKELNQSRCTCPYFLKHSNCKHVLGMKIRLKLVVVPTGVKLEQKRKRDRPTKGRGK